MAASTCKLCGAGTYSGTIGAKAPATCLNCPTSKFSGVFQAKNIDACQTWSISPTRIGTGIKTTLQISATNLGSLLGIHTGGDAVTHMVGLGKDATCTTFLSGGAPKILPIPATLKVDALNFRLLFILICVYT